MTGTTLTKDQLDVVVNAIKETLRDPSIRKLNQRAVQAKVWHLQPSLAAVLTDLRTEEDRIRSAILRLSSKLVYAFHDHTIDATLARAGILQDDRVHAGSSLDQQRQESFDLFCLDSKERLYMTLQRYGWLEDFFRLNPQHFYENSFQFVNRIPDKKLKCRVSVVGLGIGGSMAVSGLAKAGIETVVGYEKRDETGTRSVSSRYQNASWRAYDIAERLLNEESYNHLIQYRQRFNVRLDDGTTKIVTSDRVQIILGSAITAAQASAKSYGATLNFGAQTEDFYNSTTSAAETTSEKESGQDKADIVALFAGAHTTEIFPGLKEEASVFEWPELSSQCKMWLRIKESDKEDSFCQRGGEVGAEHWHYTIESARDTIEDVERVMNSLTNQYQRRIKKLSNGSDPTDDDDDEKMTEERLAVDKKYAQQKGQLESVLTAMKENKGKRFDYIFTNAPINEHNLAKRDKAGADGTIVLDGEYTVEPKMAPNAVVNGSTEIGKKLMDSFNTELVVMGGDACVPPNPQAAYGATLACEAADMLVRLAISHGHLNSIVHGLESVSTEQQQLLDVSLLEDIQQLKDLYAKYFDARSCAENYFQFVQTLICNLYSLPPMA